MPLIKSGAKAIGKQALKGDLGFASDVLAGKEAKQAAVDRARSAGSTLLRQAAKQKQKPTSRVQKKRRKRSSDIFS